VGNKAIVRDGDSELLDTLSHTDHSLNVEQAVGIREGDGRKSVFRARGRRLEQLSPPDVSSSVLGCFFPGAVSCPLSPDAASCPSDSGVAILVDLRSNRMFGTGDSLGSAASPLSEGNRNIPLLPAPNLLVGRTDSSTFKRLTIRVDTAKITNLITNQTCASRTRDRGARPTTESRDSSHSFGESTAADYDLEQCAVYRRHRTGTGGMTDTTARTPAGQAGMLQPVSTGALLK